MVDCYRTRVLTKEEVLFLVVKNNFPNQRGDFHRRKIYPFFIGEEWVVDTVPEQQQILDEGLELDVPIGWFRPLFPLETVQK